MSLYYGETFTEEKAEDVYPQLMSVNVPGSNTRRLQLAQAE